MTNYIVVTLSFNFVVFQLLVYLFYTQSQGTESK
jgi:hypothetical protein